VTVSYSISNTVNFDEVGIGTTDPLLEFPSIYGNAAFGYTVTFSHTGGPVTNVNLTLGPSYTSTSSISSDTIRITRNTSETIFPDEQYRFAKFDNDFNKTIETYLPGDVDQADSNTSIFAWETPSDTEVTGTYTFNISYTDMVTNTQMTESKSYTHTLVWSLFPGLAILQELVDRSRY